MFFLPEQKTSFSNWTVSDDQELEHVVKTLLNQFNKMQQTCHYIENHLKFFSYLSHSSVIL